MTAAPASVSICSRRARARRALAPSPAVLLLGIETLQDDREGAQLEDRQSDHDRAAEHRRERRGGQETANAIPTP